MSGKGSARRRENTALVEANWPWPDKGESDAVRELPEAPGSDEVGSQSGDAGIDA